MSIGHRIAGLAVVALMAVTVFFMIRTLAAAAGLGGGTLVGAVLATGFALFAWRRVAGYLAEMNDE